MMKLVSLAFLVLLLSSCNQKVPTDDGSEIASRPPVLVVTGPLPPEAQSFETNITFLNVDSTQQDKFDRAMEIIKKVVATEEFRDAVFNFQYNGQNTFVDNNGFTNEQIYAKILEAAEMKYPDINNAMDMQVELYYDNTTTVGYTFPNSTQIWVNTKYFNTNSVYSVAANLFHEWLHKIGFTHAVSYSVSRDSSVPYAIGRMISSIGAANNF